MTTLDEGTELGHYRILRRLGSGGMADVYEAEDIRLGRHVALKVLPPEFGRNPELATRFEKEVRAVAVLNHRGIVTVFEIGSQDTLHYYTMRLLTGGDLSKRIEEGLSPRDSLVILQELADAFVHAHERGFVHRDVKPGNVVFDEQGSPVLTDFGIAKAMDQASKVTKTGMVMGTAGYVSPEQARGRPVDPRSDIYSLGVILYEMLTGRPPYEAEESLAVIFMHVNDPIPTLPAELSELQPLLNTMMAKDPDDRISSCEQVMEMVDEVLPLFEEETASTSGSRRHTGPHRLRRRTTSGARSGLTPIQPTGQRPTVITRPPDPDEPSRPSLFDKPGPKTSEVARKREEEETRKREEEETRKREAEETRKREAEETRKREAEETRKREAEEARKREAEEARKREAEEARKREAEEARKREEEEARKREAEEARKREEEAQRAEVRRQQDMALRRKNAEKAKQQQEARKPPPPSRKESPGTSSYDAAIARARKRDALKSWLSSRAVIGLLAVAGLAAGVIGFLQQQGPAPEAERRQVDEPASDATATDAQREAERQAELKRQEAERQRQAELTRKRELERQRELEAKKAQDARQAESDRQRELERNRKRQADRAAQDAKRQQEAQAAEARKQQEAEARKQQEAEARQQQEAEARRQQEAEARRQQEAEARRQDELRRQEAQRQQEEERKRAEADKDESTEEEKAKERARRPAGF